MWYIIHRPTSSYAKKIARSLSIMKIEEDGRRTINDPMPFIINYGLSKSRLEALTPRWRIIFPDLRYNPMVINCNIPKSKYWAVNQVTVDHPISKRKLGADENPSDYIIKKFHSMGGRGIRRATTRERMADHYYQKFINRGPYEIRVHAYNWIDQSEWPVQKRVGPEDQIAWNWRQGGRFINVQAPGRYNIFKQARSMSKQVLKDLELDFGAIDFVVDTEGKIYFIEINTAPGWCRTNEERSINAFKKLTDGVRTNG